MFMHSFRNTVNAIIHVIIQSERFLIANEVSKSFLVLISALDHMFNCY
jgi:hypothetical protein